MRQAGRCLPEYRDARGPRLKDILALCINPEIAAEVTLQPMRRFAYDAAIVFADILLLPMALGQEVWFETGEGPRLGPLPSLEALAAEVESVGGRAGLRRRDAAAGARRAGAGAGADRLRRRALDAWRPTCWSAAAARTAGPKARAIALAEPERGRRAGRHRWPRRPSPTWPCRPRPARRRCRSSKSWAELLPEPDCSSGW